MIAVLVGLFWFSGSPSTYAQTDTTAPTISSVAITSNPDADIYEDFTYRRSGSSGVYGIGDDIEVTVTFSENVTASGTPKLDLDIGGTVRAAEFLETENSTVVFSYTVAEGDSDADGIAIGANKLRLNGGSIRDAAENDADLSHDALAAQTNHRVDGIRPKLTLSFMNTNWSTDKYHTAGERIWVAVSFSDKREPIFVSVAGGTPQLMLDFDGEKKAATWSGLRAGKIFEYIPQAGDLDTDGVAIEANSISLNGGIIQDAAGNDVALTHEALPANPQILVDADVPTVSSMAITSDPGQDDTYDTGDKIEVTVTFSEDVIVPEVHRSDTGGMHRPYLELDIGGEAKKAAYQNRRGPTLVFAYSVQAGDSDEDGISIGANNLHLDGGVIEDAAGNNPISATMGLSSIPLDAVVSHDALAADQEHKVSGSSSSLTLNGPTTIEYEENSVTSYEPDGKRVGQYSVSGTDDNVTWSLSGSDESLFTLGSGRILWFTSPPNYEDPKDADADNEYRVTIEASDGTDSRSLDVVVVVTNDWLDSDEVPVIIGTPQVGETLTADVSRISGPTEFSEGSFWHLWARSDGTTDTWIEGAKDSTYTVTAEDVGKRIKAVVNVGLGYGMLPDDKVMRHSEPTAVVTVPGQTNNPASGQPTISGTARVGWTLTADTSGISDSDGLDNATFSYQWLADDADISGATSSTYTLAAADLSKAVRVRVTFTDDAGYDESLTSVATAAVAAAPTSPPPAPTNLAVSDNGNGTLTLTWTAPGDDSVTGYQILRRRPQEGERALLVHVADTGSASTTWTDRNVTIGTQHVYRVQAINAAGLSRVSFYARATPASPPANISATGAPTISGTVRVGQILTAGTSGISDGNGLTNTTFSYQWLADDATISGATSSTYTLADADLGKAVKVRVSFTDDAGHNESLTSAATAAVAALQPDLASVSPVVITRLGGVHTGGTFTLSVDVRNVGQGVSAATTMRYYQSTDSIIDTSDTEVGTDDVGPLAASESVEVSEELTAPDTAGTYYYSACVDAVAGESDTSNNCSPAHELIVSARNSPATGAPTISRTAQVGETLTAGTSGISDADGLTNAAFSYQWLADDSSISGATSSTYTPVTADKGKAVKVRVSFNDDAGNTETLTSAATASVVAAPSGPPPKPTNLAASDNGDGTLTLTWNAPDDDSVTGYQILRRRPQEGERKLLVHVADTGSTETTWTDSNVTIGTRHIYRVKAINSAGLGRASVNVRVTPQAPASTPANSPATGAPIISGTARVGETLTAGTSGISDSDGLVNVAFGYQWLADDADISGATSSTYTLVDTDQGKAIKVQVSFTDDAGHAESLTSAATAAVAARPNRPATGAPTITGTVRVGETLTASTSGISDADGLDNATFSYQWLADAADISGATSSTYTLVDADQGKAVKVRVSFTDDAGHDETLTSAATAAVAARPLTASFRNMPAEHNGSKLFSFQLVFSENFPGRFPHTTLRDSAFEVTNGSVRGAERVVKGENRVWKISVRPSSNDDVVITLEAGSVSTESGRPLSNTVTARVSGPEE